MVSSGPRYLNSRTRWRRDVEGVEGVKIIFLVSLSGDDVIDQMLVEEHKKHTDILQTSLPDGHRKLGYKILTGYIWAAIHCPETVVLGKTDDNAVLDIEAVMEVVKMGRVKGDTIGCTVPNRNCKTLRATRPHMRGKQ